VGKTVRASGVTIKDSGNADVTGNYNITYADNTSSTINKADLTLSTSNVTKTYDGTTGAAGTVIVTAGSIFAGDSATGGTFAFTNRNVGNGIRTVTTSGVTVGDGVNNANYNVSYVENTSSTINQANLVLTTSDVTRTYDGTTSAAGIAQATAGTALLGGDLVSGGTFAFTDKNAGSNKTVTATGVTVHDGNGGNNYNITYADNTSSTINKVDLTVTANAVTKTYDGTTGATGTGTVAALAGAAAGESVNAAGSQAFLDKNFGVGNKTVRASGVTIKDSGNADVTGNYNITYADNSSSTINKADLTLSTSNVTKTYDGTTTAAGTAAVMAGTIFGGDSATGGTFAFTDKNFGAGNKTVTTTGVTVGDGVNNANYNITYADNTSSTINKADLTVTANAVTKTYDGTTGATGTGTVAALAGAAAGESVNAAGSQAFLDKNFGVGNKTVRASGVTIKDSGNADVTGNYNITYTDNTSSTINKADLTASATGSNKVYDGGIVATVAYSGGVAGDVLSFSGNAQFGDKNVGTGKTINVSGIAVSGTDAGNYNLLNTTATTSADITPASLSVTANNDSRLAGGIPYSGGNGVTYAGLVGGESSSVLGGTLVYGGSAQGASSAGSYAITPGGYSSGNYTIRYVDGVLSIASGGAAEAALGGTALVAAYGGAVQAVSAVGATLGGTGSSAGEASGGANAGGSGSGGAAGADAGALAAAASEAGSTGEDE
jgi:hypothetical protein